MKKDNNEPDPGNSPFILPEKGIARKHAYLWFHKKNIIPEIYAQVSGNEAILAMVSLGCGIGLVPELVININPPFDPYLVGICMSNNKKNNPFLKIFTDLVQIKRLNGDFNND